MFFFFELGQLCHLFLPQSQEAWHHGVGDVEGGSQAGSGCHVALLPCGREITPTEEGGNCMQLESSLTRQQIFL